MTDSLALSPVEKPAMRDVACRLPSLSLSHAFDTYADAVLSSSSPCSALLWLLLVRFMCGLEKPALPLLSLCADDRNWDPAAREQSYTK